MRQFNYMPLGLVQVLESPSQLLISQKIRNILFFFLNIVIAFTAFAWLCTTVGLNTLQYVALCVRVCVGAGLEKQNQ